MSKLKSTDNNNRLLAVHRLILFFAVGVSTATVAHADCFAEYKAKKSINGVLELHYGVISIPDGDCTSPGSTNENVRKRLKEAGWDLLAAAQIITKSKAESLEEEAGEYFLKY